MISYTQRNPVSEALAYKISAAFSKRGKSVWLDVEMARRDEAAMEEGVKNSRCVIAIISGPQEGQEGSAYFSRPFCVQELRWAGEVGVPVQPIVAAEDKGKITEFFATIPPDLQHLTSANWEHVDRKDNDYFELGVTKIIRAALGQTASEDETQALLGDAKANSDAIAEGVPPPSRWCLCLCPTPAASQ